MKSETNLTKIIANLQLQQNESKECLLKSKNILKNLS